MRRLACLVIPPWCFRPAMQDVDNGRKSAVVSLLAAMAGFGLIPIFLRYFTDYLDAWTVNGVPLLDGPCSGCHSCCSWNVIP